MIERPGALRRLADFSVSSVELAALRQQGGFECTEMASRWLRGPVQATVSAPSISSFWSSISCSSVSKLESSQGSWCKSQRTLPCCGSARSSRSGSPGSHTCTSWSARGSERRSSVSRSRTCLGSTRVARFVSQPISCETSTVIWLWTSASVLEKLTCTACIPARVSCEWSLELGLGSASAW